MALAVANTAVSGFGKRFEKGVDFVRKGWYSNQAVRQGGGREPKLLKKKKKVLDKRREI